jgi:hypothetical protein
LGGGKCCYGDVAAEKEWKLLSLADKMLKAFVGGISREFLVEIYSA